MIGCSGDLGQPARTPPSSSHDTDRVVSSINFGTRSSDGFASGGTQPSLQGSGDPQEFATVTEDLITTLTYNDRGLVEASTDSDGKVTKSFYDDFNRRIAVAENHQSGDPVSLAWDGTNNRWSVTAGLDANNLDENRVTSFAYDGENNVVSQDRSLRHRQRRRRSGHEVRLRCEHQQR